jgi:hypothetical protein
MLRKILTLFIGTISLVSISLGTGYSSTFAATSANPSYGQALEIAPPLIYLSVNPGQTLTTQIYIRDISSGSLIVSGIANNFIAAGQDGTPKILLNNSTPDPFAMESWLAPIPSLTLVPREIKALIVTLHIPANATPGGHYGVIRFTATPPSLQGSGVSIATSLGSLMLVTVSGKITENLSVNNFSVNHGGTTGTIFQSGPLNFVEQLKNNGNVQEQPIGQVTIKDMFGNKLAAVNVNLPPANVLPDSIRKFSEPLDSTVIGNKILFGKYTANLKITYGASHKVITETLVFWVIPYTLIAIVIILLVGGFFILRTLIRRYNRYILAQSQKVKRK